MQPRDPFSAPPAVEPSPELPGRVVSRSQMLFGFEGRIRRADYWGHSIFVWLAWLGVVFFLRVLPEPAAMIVLVIVWLTLAWIIVALAVKRLHDRDRPAWWLLLNVVPLLNLWLQVEVGFLPGTPGPNRYGPDPKSAG